MTVVGECLCGCGEPVSRKQKFRPGHDQRLRVALEQEIGGLEAMKELVEEHLGREVSVRTVEW